MGQSFAFVHSSSYLTSAVAANTGKKVIAFTHKAVLGGGLARQPNPADYRRPIRGSVLAWSSAPCSSQRDAFDLDLVAADQPRAADRPGGRIGRGSLGDTPRCSSS